MASEIFGLLHVAMTTVDKHDNTRWYCAEFKVERIGTASTSDHDNDVHIIYFHKYIIMHMTQECIFFVGPRFLEVKLQMLFPSAMLL